MARAHAPVATPHQPRLGLALGSGSARGWSHIGVIRVLEEAGIVPDIVCGSSIGALVGAAYAAGEIERLEPWVRSLHWKAVIGLLDLKMGGGLIEGGKLVDFFRQRFVDRGIEHLDKVFACTATDLASGREVWLREGATIEAVRASIALPGLFTPVMRDGSLLVDGGLVNPVPVSLCRALGADVVIAVDLNWDLVGRRTRIATHEEADDDDSRERSSGLVDAILARFRPGGRNGDGNDTPSMLDVLASSLNIMQVRITQSRLAGEPADVMIRPRLADIAAMDFHRGALAISEGERAATQALPAIREMLALRSSGG